MQQAKDATREIAAGKYRGPLHGIPFGVKDLSTPEASAPPGARSLSRSRAEADLVVVKRLYEAGAVLLAKLSLGRWRQRHLVRRETKNPCPRRGLGREQRRSRRGDRGALVGILHAAKPKGSIIDPSMRCGVTGLRPPSDAWRAPAR